jgi:hypothetical protein
MHSAFVDSNFSTSYPALEFSTSISARSRDNDVMVLSIRVTLNVGIPVSEDKKDDKHGMGCTPEKYECGPGIERDGEHTCACII